MVHEYFYMGLLTRIVKVVNPSLRMRCQNYTLPIPWFIRKNHITLEKIYEHEKDEYNDFELRAKLNLLLPLMLIEHKFTLENIRLQEM